MQISVPGYVLHCESFNTNLAAVLMKKYTKEPCFCCSVEPVQTAQNQCCVKCIQVLPSNGEKNCDYKITEYSMESLPKKVEMCMSVIMHVMVIN